MIYVPRLSIDLLLAVTGAPQPPKHFNATVNTRIEYKGYEISIACDSSHGPGDLRRSEMRIYIGDNDVTYAFFPYEEYPVLPGTAENLKEAFARIDSRIG